MVTNQDLADVAIVLGQILAKHHVKFGLFGGYAVTLLGGQRSCDKLDCRVAATQTEILRILDGKGGFRTALTRSHAMIHTTTDSSICIAPNYGEPLPGEEGIGALGMLWNSKRDTAGASTVWVLFRCDDCFGVQDSLASADLLERKVTGRYEGMGITCVLNPFHLFCCKVRAVAVRDQFTDTVDIRSLVKHHGNAIRARAGELDLWVAGLVIKRDANLGKMFGELGVDVAVAMELVGNQALSSPDGIDLTSTKAQSEACGVAGAEVLVKS